MAYNSDQWNTQAYLFFTKLLFEDRICGSVIAFRLQCQSWDIKYSTKYEMICWTYHLRNRIASRSLMFSEGWKVNESACFFLQGPRFLLRLYSAVWSFGGFCVVSRWILVSKIDRNNKKWPIKTKLETSRNHTAYFKVCFDGSLLGPCSLKHRNKHRNKLSQPLECVQFLLSIFYKGCCLVLDAPSF